MSSRMPSLMELLEHRQLFSGGLVADNPRLIFNAVNGAAPSVAQTVNLTNTTASPITIAAGGETIDGADAAEFQLAGGAALPAVIQPGQSVVVLVQFAATRIGPAGALLHVVDNDPVTPETDITLRGLGTKGQFDTLEPSLQWILDTYQIPVNVGASDPTQNVMDIVPKQPNDELGMHLLAKAGPGPVTVDPIAAFTSVSIPAFYTGYYNFAGGTLTRTQEFSVPAADVQTVNPHVIGTDQFDPGAGPFGLYTQWPGQKNRVVWTEAFRNTWQTDNRLKQSMRFYPLKNADGTVVPNAYVVAVEEATNHDYQDAVLIVRNVRPASPSQSPNWLSSTPSVSRQMFLTWSDNASNEAGYALDRSVNGGPFLPLASVGPNVTRYYDNNLSAGSRYAYRVRAYGADGVSDFAASAPVLIPVNYEAEAAALSGPVIQSSIPGFSGTGYAAFQNATGDTIHWQANVAQAGVVNLTFRYASSAVTSTGLQLSVNGKLIRANLAFAPTAGAWHTVSVAVLLTTGLNDVVLATIGAVGPAIDMMTVR